MESVFHIVVRRHGATVHLTPRGELDDEAGPAFDRVRGALDTDVDVAVCDMGRLEFMDVSGLHHLIDFAHAANARGVAFLAWRWQGQPARLLTLIDGPGRFVTAAGADPATVAALLRRDAQARATAARLCGIDTLRAQQLAEAAS
ncbi:STAS domain-containing protein [Streptomyces sp. NPDC054787]